MSITANPFSHAGLGVLLMIALGGGEHLLNLVNHIRSVVFLLGRAAAIPGERIALAARNGSMVGSMKEG